MWYPEDKDFAALESWGLKQNPFAAVADFSPMKSELRWLNAENRKVYVDYVKRRLEYIAGKNFANPTALLLSAVLMLRHIDEGDAADRIMAAVNRVLESGQARTRDLGGTTSTFEFADAVCRAIA